MNNTTPHHQSRSDGAGPYSVMPHSGPTGSTHQTSLPSAARGAHPERRTRAVIDNIFPADAEHLLGGDKITERIEPPTTGPFSGVVTW
jgi:hypothetical protein